MGRLKLENWRVYVQREHHSVKKPSNTWKAWDSWFWVDVLFWVMVVLVVAVSMWTVRS